MTGYPKSISQKSLKCKNKHSKMQALIQRFNRSDERMWKVCALLGFSAQSHAVLQTHTELLTGVITFD